MSSCDFSPKQNGIVEMISLRVHVARKPDFVTSEQQRCKTEYASAQSDHRLYFSLSLNL